MRQIKVATTSAGLSMPNAAHHSRPAKIAPSAIRSHAASSTAPNRVPPPRSRAMVPSSMSASTNTATAKAPHHSCPIGNSVNDASTVPAVPRIVMLSGVKPTRRAALATGRDSLV